MRIGPIVCNPIIMFLETICTYIFVILSNYVFYFMYVDLYID